MASQEFITSEENVLCSRCKKEPAVVFLSIPNKVKGLPIQKLYPACRQCCKETGVQIPNP
jgi:hypothetical protein